MFVDTATLQDLEIVATPGRRGTTLWSMIDRTRTQAGAHALRQGLLVPLHTADEIVALQQAHHALAAEKAYRILLDRADLNGVERYLAVTWQLPEAMPALARFRRWYRPYLKDVTEGQRGVAGLLTAAADLRARLSAAGCSVLRKVGEKLAALSAQHRDGADGADLTLVHRGSSRNVRPSQRITMAVVAPEEQ